MSNFNLGTARGRIELDSAGVEGGIGRAQQAWGGLKSELQSSPGLFSSVVNSLSSMGDQIIGVFTTAAQVVGAAIAGVTAYSLWGGLKRVLDTEDARKLFGQMGSSADEVDDILGGLNDTFEKSSFSYPDVYNVAAQLRASGTALEDLNDQTRTVGDLAAFSGAEFSRVGDLVTKIGAQGKVSGEELMSLANMGIPIRQILADGLGVSVEELNEMISAGEVTSDMFHEVIGETDMVSGSMETMADTTRGAWDTLKAGIAGAGQVLLEPWFGENGTMVGFLKAINEQVFGSVIPALTAFGEWLNTVGMDYIQNTMVPALERMADIFTNTIVPAIQTAVDWIKSNEESIRNLLAAMGPAAGILGALAVAISLVRKAFQLMMLATPLGMVMALVTGLVYAWQNSETFRDIVTSAFEAIQTAVGPVIDFIVGLVERFTENLGGGGDSLDRFRSIAETVGEAIRTGLGAAIQWLRDLWDTLSPRFDSIRESFNQIIEAISPVVSWIGERLPGAFQFLWGVVEPIIGFIVSLLGDTLIMAIDGVVQFFQGAFQAIAGIFEVFAGLFTGDWSRMWEGIKQIFVGLWNAIVGLVKTYLAGTVLKIFGGALKAITGLWRSVWGGIRSFFSGIWQTLTGLVRTGTTTMSTVIKTVMGVIRTVIRTVWKAIQTVVQTAVNAVRTRVTSAFNAVRTTITNAVNTARSVVGTAFSAVRSGITTAVNAARAVVSSVFSAIRSTMSNAATAARDLVIRAFTRLVSSVGTKIRDLLSTVRGIPGRIRDALGNLGNLLRNSGRKIIEGLIGGITSMAQRVKDSVTGVLKSARDLLPFSPAKEGPFSGKGWTLYSGKSMMDALAAGIESEEGTAKRALENAMGSISDAASIAPSLSTPMAGSGGSSSESLAFSFNFSGASFGDGSPQEVQQAVMGPDVIQALTRAARAGRRN